MHDFYIKLRLSRKEVNIMSIWVQYKNYNKRIYKYMPQMHSHPFYELYYLKSGSRIYHTEGGSETRFSAGDFVCIRPGLNHLMRGMVSESVIIRFGESDIPPYLANDIKLCFDKLILVSYPPERTAELEVMLDRMFSDFVSVGANSSFTMRMLFNVLLTDISRLIHSGSCLPRKAAFHDAIVKTAEYIDSNYASPITVDELSSVACMSRSYFSRTFHEITGMTAVEYINRARITAACKLLLTTNAKTNEIAEAAGFSNNSYFCHLFKTHIGITPGEYRKNRGMK